MRSEHRAPLVASIVVVLACIGVMAHAVRTDALGGLVGPIHRALLAAPVLHPKPAPTQPSPPATAARTVADVDPAAGRDPEARGVPATRSGPADGAGRQPRVPTGGGTRHFGQDGARQDRPRDPAPPAAPAAPAPAAPAPAAPAPPDPVASTPVVPTAPVLADRGPGDSGPGRGHGWGRADDPGNLVRGLTSGQGVRDAVKSVVETGISTLTRGTGRGGGQGAHGTPGPTIPSVPALPTPPPAPSAPPVPGRGSGGAADLVNEVLGGLLGTRAGGSDQGPQGSQGGGWGRGWGDSAWR